MFKLDDLRLDPELLRRNIEVLEDGECPVVIAGRVLIVYLIDRVVRIGYGPFAGKRDRPACAGKQSD